MSSSDSRRASSDPTVLDTPIPRVIPSTSGCTVSNHCTSTERAGWRGAAAETYVVSPRIVHQVPKQTEIPDDETLRQRVESQLFRDRHVPKGNLNISAEHGMVILRGELDSPLEIAQLEERVRRI